MSICQYIQTYYVHLSPCCRLGVKIFKMDNRKIVFSFLVLALIGVALIGDWQTIGQGEPCSLTESTNTSELAGSGYAFTNSSQICEIMSDLNSECYWNPESVITQELCTSCLPICFSRQSTINFYQFMCGMFLLALSFPIVYVLNSALASGVAPINSQVYNNIEITHVSK